MSKRTTKPKWRASEGYHYYETDSIGLGYAHPAATGGYLAACCAGTKVFPRLREAKAWIEHRISKQRSRR